MQASFDLYLRLSFETAPNSGTFPVLSLSKAQGGGWRNQRQRLGEGQVVVGLFCLGAAKKLSFVPSSEGRRQQRSQIVSMV